MHEWRERREFNKQRVEGDVGLRGSDVYESGSLRRVGRELKGSKGVGHMRDRPPFIKLIYFNVYSIKNTPKHF